MLVYSLGLGDRWASGSPSTDEADRESSSVSHTLAAEPICVPSFGTVEHNYPSGSRFRQVSPPGLSRSCAHHGRVRCLTNAMLELCPLPYKNYLDRWLYSVFLFGASVRDLFLRRQLNHVHGSEGGSSFSRLEAAVKGEPVKVEFE